MKTKLFIKISILLFALFMVVTASKYFASPPFEKSLDQAFNLPGKPFQWCSYSLKDQNKKFEWLNSDLKKKINVRDGQLTAVQISQKYCTVQLENIQGIDLKSVRWEKLAQGFDSAGEIVTLEWDQSLQVFRVSGLPFKSSILYTDLIN